MLPAEAQDVIGKVHEKTVPALKMLEQEGFVIQNFVDIFDGGPTVSCETANIRTIRESRVATIVDMSDPSPAHVQLVSNRALEFRSVLGTVEPRGEGAVAIDKLTALRLELKLGDSVRYVAVRPRSSVSPRR